MSCGQRTLVMFLGPMGNIIRFNPKCVKNHWKMEEEVSWCGGCFPFFFNYFEITDQCTATISTSSEQCAEAKWVNLSRGNTWIRALSLPLQPLPCLYKFLTWFIPKMSVQRQKKRWNDLHLIYTSLDHVMWEMEGWRRKPEAPIIW